MSGPFRYDAIADAFQDLSRDRESGKMRNKPGRRRNSADLQYQTESARMMYVEGQRQGQHASLFLQGNNHSLRVSAD
jgi:hypothetical protein